MKRKTYRIVFPDDPPRHDAQPSENRAPDTAGRNHAGPAFEQQQSNGMPPTPTSGDSDMPAADETKPNLVITAPAGAKPVGDSAGEIMNELEIM